MRRFAIQLGLILTLLVCANQAAFAQLTAEHRKELAELTKQVGQAAALIKKKNYDEAGTLLKGVEEKLKEISTAASVPETDPALKRVSILVDKQQAILDKAGGAAPAAKADELSFMKDVAPIINQRCIECHGETNPRNGLRLDTFAGWRAGGRSGQLLVPGNPTASLIVARINAAEGQGRMPRNGDPLSGEDKEKITNWIKKGARFDGGNENLTLAAIIFEEAKKNVKIPKPTGKETVSFTKDIAPFMTNLCLNCHNARRQAGGLSVENFFDIMKGGESGEVIIPGDMENSRFFRLVGGLELPRMPQGQGRITRQNYEDLKKWFEEGNTYDGGDPLTPIRSFVPSAAEMAKSTFGSKSEDEMRALRETGSMKLFHDAAGSAEPARVNSENFLLLGNVDQRRLETVQGWADSQLKRLQTDFSGNGQAWRGRLAILVLKDREDYEQLAEAEEKRIDNETFGHAKVTLGHEDAYVVLQDLGDKPARGPGLQASLVEQLTAAYLSKGDRPLPLWLTNGTGLMMAEELLGPAQVKAMKETAAGLAPAVNQPDEVFVDGTFSAASSGAIGYTLVKYLIDRGGMSRFVLFVRALERGDAVNAALQSIYGSNSTTVANAYFASLKAR
ncbi:c-type cytochrome domain-containing protein [Planctomicrobium piriforme]|uniref:Planctomycete cytochrome C n=1 Tax=Planctomicrobium piriforme TaxID=1576369 RepID=A0A1I3G0U7_9PLAN|nr:c-type cytochrome domain-containing protein [Planctomicrobium piriforme]SFI17090.1 Planctomycete cytochrome C [Planctomicrobium piriforme]